MLFNKPTLDGLRAGTLSWTFRRWTVVRPKVGSRFTTRAGVVEVTAIEQVDVADLTEPDAYGAGYASLGKLLKWVDAREGDLYRIGIRVVGEDPRIALRNLGALSDEERLALSRKLDRMDAAADEPWTRQTLQQIQQQPAVVSTVLAEQVGQPRDYWKIRVRRLKALGLTESLEVGYRLSPRGAALLAAEAGARD